jgi:hypothetical protein
MDIEKIPGLLPEQGFGHDTAGGISGAEDEDIHDDLRSEISLARLDDSFMTGAKRAKKERPHEEGAKS